MVFITNWLVKTYKLVFCFIDLNTGSSSRYWDQTRTGSWDKFTDNKWYKMNSVENALLTGNIETMYKSCGKGLYKIAFHNMHFNGSYSNKLTGSIQVLGDMYDLEIIILMGYTTMTGTWSMLAKLQKLTKLYLQNKSGITGSKADLYNKGANVTESYSYVFVSN